VYPSTRHKLSQQQAEQPKDAEEFTCEEPGYGEICKLYRQGAYRITPENIVSVVGKQLQSINFILLLKNPIFLGKFPLIKLQICRQIGQAKSSNGSNFNSMAALFLRLLRASERFQSPQ